MQDKLAIIDMGSNTMRLVVYEYEPGLSFKLIDEVREVARLGEGIDSAGRLSNKAMKRATETLKLFHAFCQANDLQHIIATATSAVRDATNQTEFLAMVQREAGLTLSVLSGEQEAYYGYLGATNSLRLEDGIVLDLGGGSVELTQVRYRRYVTGTSLPLGAVRLTDTLIHSDPVSDDDFNKLTQHITDKLHTVPWLAGQPGQMLAGMGGTVRNLAKIDRYYRDYPLAHLHGYSLARTAVDRIVARLRSLPVSRRRSIPGLNADRADIMLAGAMVIQTVMHLSGCESLTVCGQGLREGLLYKELLGEQPEPILGNVRRFGVENLARFYHYQARHAQHVERLSLQLFDQLQSLHGFGSTERELLSAAALLHDIGTVVDYFDHHQHTAYLILSNGIAGYNHRETALIAQIARYHRKGSPKFDGLDAVMQPHDDTLIAQISALLRLAEYLERARNQVIQAVRCTIFPERLRIKAITQGDATVELWSARQHIDLMEEAYGLKVELEAAY